MTRAVLRRRPNAVISVSRRAANQKCLPVGGRLQVEVRLARLGGAADDVQRSEMSIDRVT